MKIKIIRVAKGGSKWADQAVEQWMRRIQNRLPTEEIRIKPSPDRGSIEQRRKEESRRVLNLVQPGDRLVVLDERGVDISTEELSDWLQNSMNSSTKRILFAIGGPFGHDPEIRTKAWKTLRLSSMVLNHELARVILVEQIYRAYTLIWGGSYHH